MKQINFALNLKNLRENAKMSQTTLAKLLGVNQRTVSAWEKEICEPSFQMLLKICEIFDEDFNSILT